MRARRPLEGEPQIALDPRLLEELLADGVLRRTFLRLDDGRRSAVVAAALEVASERGVEEVSIKEVAKRAGVPVGSLYQYFGDRAALIRFICVLATRSLTDTLEQYGPMLAQLPLAEGLRTYLREAIAWGGEQPQLIRLQAVAAYTLACRGSPPLGRGPQPRGTHRGETGRREPGRPERHRRGRDGAPIPERAIVDAIAVAMERLIEGMVQAAKERGELREGLGVPAVAAILNVVMLAIVDASLLPGLDEYYRLYRDGRTPERICDDLVTLLSRALLASDTA